MITVSRTVSNQQIAAVTRRYWLQLAETSPILPQIELDPAYPNFKHSVPIILDGNSRIRFHKPVATAEQKMSFVHGLRPIHS
jgi:hypothetical protein